MAINELIAGGIKLPQFNLPDYGADLAQMAQIQNARNQNALAQYQLGAAQRAEAKDVARTNALMAAGSDEDAIANALLKIGDVTGYSALIKAKEERQKTRLEKNKLTNEIVDQRLKQSRSFLDTLDPNDPNVGPKLKGWHAGNHADEYLGPLLKSFGATTENSTAEIDNAIAGGPAKIEEFLNRSRLAADKFADFMQMQNDVRQITGGVQAGTPPQMGAPSAAAMPASALSTVAPSVAAPPSRINFVKSEIDRFSNVLSNNPSNKLAADRLQALTTEYNQLSAEQGREATLKENIRAAEVREELDRKKHQLEIDKFNASQKEFKVEKTPQGLMQINKDGTVAPILGADGKQVQSLEFAKSEIKTNADGNYIAFNPYTNESRIITGADGKPVRSLEAANAAETKRHNQELERQGNVKIGQENRRIQLAQQQANEPKYNAERGGFVYPPSKENPEGRFVPLTGGDGRPLTEGQGKSTAYGLRMTEANQILEKLANEGTERAAIGAGAPYGIGAIVNKATASPQQQQVYQAKLNFITANLRQESGAVIGESEFETEDKKYFPQIGDSPEVLAQKKRARQLAIKAMEVQAGPGAKEIEKFRDSSKPSAAPSGPPKIGSVQEGYKFKGGDPANPKNWEKL
jgi:hypothetical protein